MKKKNGYPKRKRKFERLILPLLKTMKNYAVKCVSGRVSFKGGQGVSFKGGKGFHLPTRMCRQNRKPPQGADITIGKVSTKHETTIKGKLQQVSKCVQ